MGHLFQLDSLRKAMLQIRLANPLDGYSWVARVKPTVRWRLHLIDLSEGTIPIFVSLEHDSFLAHNLAIKLTSEILGETKVIIQSFPSKRFS